jgi:hypothetical protein
MRQPAIPSTLHTLIAALPDEALRPLVLALLQNGATTPAALPARAAQPVAKKRPHGWPKGKLRGPRKAAGAANADQLVDAIARNTAATAEAKRAERLAKQKRPSSGEPNAPPRRARPAMAPAAPTPKSCGATPSSSRPASRGGRSSESLEPTKPWRWTLTATRRCPQELWVARSGASSISQ